MAGPKRNARGPPDARRGKPHQKNRRRGTKIADTQEIDALKSGQSDGDKAQGPQDRTTSHSPEEATRKGSKQVCDEEQQSSVKPRPTLGIHDAVRNTETRGMQTHYTGPGEIVPSDAETEDTEDPYMSPQTKNRTECDLRNLHRLELEAQNRNKLETVERIRKIAQDTHIPDSMHVDLAGSQDIPTTGYGNYVANFGTPQLSREPSQRNDFETPPSSNEHGMYGEVEEDPHLEAPRGGKFMYMLGIANLGLLDPAITCPSIPIGGDSQSASPIAIEPCNSPLETPMPLPTIFEERRSLRIPREQSYSGELHPQVLGVDDTMMPKSNVVEDESVPTIARTQEPIAAGTETHSRSIHLPPEYDNYVTPLSPISQHELPIRHPPKTGPRRTMHNAGRQGLYGPRREKEGARHPSINLAIPSRENTQATISRESGCERGSMDQPTELSREGAISSKTPRPVNSVAAPNRLHSSKATKVQSTAAPNLTQSLTTSPCNQSAAAHPSGKPSRTHMSSRLGSGKSHTRGKSGKTLPTEKFAAAPTRGNPEIASSRKNSTTPMRGKATALSSSSTMPSTRNPPTVTRRLNTTAPPRRGPAATTPCTGTESGMPCTGNPPASTQGKKMAASIQRENATAVSNTGTQSSTPPTCDPPDTSTRLNSTATNRRRNGTAPSRTSTDHLFSHQLEGTYRPTSQAPGPVIGGSGVTHTGNMVIKRPLRQDLALQELARVRNADKLRKRKERAKKKGVGLPNTIGGAVSTVKRPLLELADGEPLGTSHSDLSTALSLILPTELPAFRLFRSVTLEELQRIHQRLAAQFTNGESLLPTWTRASLRRLMKPRRTRIRKKVKRHLAKVARNGRGQQPVPLPEGVFQIELEQFKIQLADREFLKVSKLMSENPLGMLKSNGCGNYCGAGGYHRAKAIIRKQLGRPATVADLRKWKAEKQAAYENGPSRIATTRRANGVAPLPTINVETTSSSGTDKSMRSSASDDTDEEESGEGKSGEEGGDGSTDNGDESETHGSEKESDSGDSGVECSAAPVAAELEEMDPDWHHPIKGPLAFCRRWRFLWKMEPTDHDVVAWDDNGRPPLYHKP